MSQITYHVISAYSDEKIKTHIPQGAKSIISQFITPGYKFTTDELIKKNMKNKKTSCSIRSFQRYHYKALTLAVSLGILKKESMNLSSTPAFKQLETIQYWQNQLRSSKYKNMKNKTHELHSTKSTYLYHLWNFNTWLIGKKFKIRKTVNLSEDTFKSVENIVSFNNVEDLIILLDTPFRNTIDIVKIIKRYLLDPIHNGKQPKYVNLIFAAIVSYFDKNDHPLIIKFNANAKYDDQEIQQTPELSLEDLMKMLTIGKPSVAEKAMYLCKFHRGLDSSTFADRFNFEAYDQIIKHFGIENHQSWDLEKCPVPIELVRIKTGYQHIGFLERDAIEALQNYLDYRFEKTDHRKIEGALFLNKFGNPVSDKLISSRFFNLAVNAGIQKKIINKQYKIGSHELRDLLKSTLIDSGCRIDVADHVIGHKPKDSYEKQSKLYPETMRKEYSKASKRLNIFTKFSNVISGKDDPDAIIAELNEKNIEMDKMLKKQKEQTVTRYQDEFFIKRQQDQMENVLREMSDMKSEMKEIKSLKKEKSEKLEFCCIGCEMVHDKESCPACGSKQRRIYEEKVNTDLKELGFKI